MTGSDEGLDFWEIQDRNERLGIVDCDQHCGAKVSPETLEEALTAVEHWRKHSYIGGCSHGC